MKSRIGARGALRRAGRLVLATAAVGGLVGLAACTPDTLDEPEDDRVTSPDGASDDAATSAEWSDAAWNMQAIGAPVLWDYAEREDLEPVAVGVFDSFRAGHLHDDLGDVDASLVAAETAEVEKAAAHGTHVAGLLASSGAELRGTAPNADLRLAGYGVSSDDPSKLDMSIDAEHVSDSALITGIGGLADGGASIVNVSQGMNADSAVGAASRDKDALTYARTMGDAIGAELEKIVDEHPDLLIVAAAGNSSCTTPEREADNCEDEAEAEANWGFFAQARAQHPELQDHILVVGASARIDDSAGLEEWGRSERGADILAPGKKVLSTIDPAACEDGVLHFDEPPSIRCDPRGYGAMSGTSMAAPHVAGVAAVLRGVNPDLTADQVRRIIVTTANGTPTLRVDQGGGAFRDDGVPSLDAPAALRIAQRTVGMSQGQIDELLADPTTDDGVPPALQGTWCAREGDESDCVELASYREGHERADPLSLRAEDPTGRTSLASTFRACADGPCDERGDLVALRYLPPGAIAGCAPSGARDDCSDAERKLASAAPIGWPRLEEIGEDGAVTELYLPSLAPDQGVDLTGSWCATEDSVEDGCVEIDQSAGTMTSDGEAAQEVRAAMPNGGWEPLAEGVSSDTCTQLDAGDFGAVATGGIAPFGTFCPEDVPLDAPAGPDIADHPDEDRIANPQTGTMLLRSGER